MIDFATSESLDASRVLADALQSAGDPRGELLALELASHASSSWEEARRLNRRAQQLREAEAGRVWPTGLPEQPAGAKVKMRAGFIVEVSFPWRMDLGTLAPTPDARAIRSLKGARLLELPSTLRPTHLIPLIDPDAPKEPSSERLAPLLAELRSLAWFDYVDARLEALLAARPPLEQLQLRRPPAQSLEGFMAFPLQDVALARCVRPDLEQLRRLSQLRSLSTRKLGDSSPRAEAATFEALAALDGLERLAVDEGGTAPSWRTLVPRLPRLRELSLLRGAMMGDHSSWSRAHRSLAALESLESLGAQDRFVDARLLEQLPRLRRLQLWTSDDQQGRRRRTPLPSLEHLAVSFPLLDTLGECPSPSLAVGSPTASFLDGPSPWPRVANLSKRVPLRALEFERIRPGPIPAELVPRLSSLESLALTWLPQTPDAVAMLARLPRLHRLRVEQELTTAEHRALARALPSVRLETTRWWPGSGS